jgi:hypothetical protein|nr:hypothetical protein [uncultured Mediterranean phage uvMED]|tara:strand:+ start:278 stop:508 length:231 start_codon:yes stop_codon:yes gene_type:complete
MQDEKAVQAYIKKLKEDYQFTFSSEEGKQVLSDLEKRCHYHTSTNVKGDSHESAYQEGQRSILLFIKQMLQKEKDK